MRLAAWITLLGLLALPLPTPAEPEAPRESSDTWYVVEMLGQRAGYMHVETRPAVHEGRPAWRTVTDMVNEVARQNGGRTETLRVRTHTDWLEDAGGNTLRIENRLDQGGGEIVTEVRVEGREAVLTVRSEAGERRLRVGWDEASAGPGRSEQAVEDILSGKKTVARFKSFSLEAGNRLLDVIVRLVERLPEGGAVLEQELTDLGIITRETYDAEGELVRQEVGPLVLRRSSREEALAPITEDLAAFESWTVALDRRLESPRSLRRATYRVVPREGAELSFETLFVQDHRQRLRTDSVEVAADGVSTAASDPAEEDLEAFLGGSTLIESDDPDIRRLATRLVGDLGPREAAHKLEAWVHENVHYRGSGVGLASARRTLRSRDGDCTENAFLLTALLRAAEIPARVVVGLAYAGSPGAFIPHAWVEAWMPGEDGGGAWGSLDSALYRAPADSDALPDVDAAHLAMAKTAGGEEGALLEISAPILNGLGRFDLGWVEPQPPDEPPPGGTTGVSTGGSRISPPSSASSTR